MTTLGQRIKELRQSKKITQQELANQFSVERSTVASWETDRSSPSAETVARLSEIFGVTNDYLLSGKKFVYTPPSDTKPLENFIREFSAMDTDEQKKTIQSLFDILLEDKDKKGKSKK
jgi:transcriptional regulator with XRE-family HTH domain